MKADARRIRAALSAPDDTVRLYLLHGPDTAGAADLAQLLARAMGPEAERVDLDGAALAKDPARLADEAASLSLFGAARYIRVSGTGDESVAAIEALLAAPRAGHPVVAIAPTARTTSRLVKLALAAPAILAHACYEPGAQEIERLVTAMAREQGLIAEPGVARRLAQAAGSDRAVIARELDKLALYLDALPEASRPLDHAALDAVGADLGDGETVRLVAAAVEGRAADFAAEVAAFDAGGGSAVTWLRALSRRLVALAEMRAAIDAGQPVDAAMKRHRVSFREEGTTRQLLQRWSAAMLAEGLARVVAAEREATRAGTPGGVVADRAGLTLARAVARG